MDKNDFDVDFDFEEEYGFDPKDFLDEDEDFDYTEILEEDLPSEDTDATKEYHFDQSSQEPQEELIEEDTDEDLAADFPMHGDPEEVPECDDDVQSYDENEEEQLPAPEYEEGGEEASGKWCRCKDRAAVHRFGA